jgi:hypothetical protein
MIIRGHNKWSGVYPVARFLEGDHDRCNSIVPVSVDGIITFHRLFILYPDLWIDDHHTTIKNNHDTHQENVRWAITNAIQKLLNHIYKIDS